MYQQQEGYNQATDGRINFKLGENFQREGETRDTPSWQVDQLDRKQKYGGHSAYRMEKSTEKF